MIKDKISNISNLPELQNPAWQTVFTWLKEVSIDTKNGIHEIQGRDIYANVMDESTLNREESVFEVHHIYIDLHYCISGDEIIEYGFPAELEKKTEYEPEKDAQLFLVGKDSQEEIKLATGDFAIFKTNEAHAPRIKLTSDRIKKVVIKIKAELLN